MAEIVMDFDVKCDECGGTLAASMDRQMMTLYVSPCEKCIRSAHEEGSAEGYEEGYDVGLNSGRD